MLLSQCHCTNLVAFLYERQCPSQLGRPALQISAVDVRIMSDKIGPSRPTKSQLCFGHDKPDKVGNKSFIRTKGLKYLKAAKLQNTVEICFLC